VPFQSIAAEGWLTGWSYRKSHVINPATGVGTNYQVKIKVYYHNVGVWTRREDLTAARADMSAVVYNDRIYVFGGYGTSDTDRRAEVFEYNPADDSWTTKTPMTYARWGGAATVLSGTAYVFGGNDGANNNRVEAYDIEDDSWTTKKSLPSDLTHMYGGQNAIAVGNKIYLFCQEYVYEYNPTTDEYTRKTDAPVKKRYGACAYVNVDGEDRIYVLGGFDYDTNDSSDTVYYYRPSNDSWSSAQATAPYKAHGVLRENPVINGKIYYGFGLRDSTGQFYNTFYSYDPSTNVWSSELASAAYAKDGLACGVVNGKLYAIGGRDIVYNPYGLNYNEEFNLNGTGGDKNVILNERCRTDFGDVRFTDDDGVTLLDYWMESKIDNNSATFWVKVADDLSSNNATIYIYYGKSDATTTSNGYNTFSFFDDFEDGTQSWTVVSGTWTESGGVLKETATATARVKKSFSDSGGMAYEFLAKHTGTVSNYPWLGIEIKSPNANYQQYDQGYLIIAYSSGGEGGVANRMRILKATGGSVSELGVTSVTIPRDVWNRYKVTYYSNTIKYYLDDVEKVSATDATYTTGEVIRLWVEGLHTLGEFDYVFVRKYVSPEPSHGNWGSEETSDSVIIDRAFVSDERADVSSVQTIGFHAKWNNGSDVVGGSIYVNGTNYVTNSTGWINVRAAARIEAPDNFTIIALPDTQFYSASHPEIFDSQTQWVVNNAQSMNIVFVTHEGDIVDDYSSLSQWNNANNSMSKLDVANVSYGVLPGNHDGSPLYLSNFNEFFNYSRFNGKSWYGGAYQNENANNFELFHGEQDDYLIFHFQYDPSDQVLAWANSTLQNYPNRRVIVTTHSYLNVDGSRTDIGNRIWQNFVAPHADQIFLVLCGHNHAETQRTDIINGHTVYQIMADYQDRTNGGNGWLRTLEFHPVEDKIYVRTYSPHLNNYETDADSQFTLDYDMTRAASSIVEKVKWIVTGVNCSGITAYSQIVQNPSIIWDRIKIVDGGISKGLVMLGEKVTVWFKALYEYDNDTFDGANGVLYLNGFPMLWSTANNRWEYDYTATTSGTKMFIISGVSDSSYDLTVINDNIGAQTLDVWSLPFSVTSNSTITELAFNSTSKILSFTVSGIPGDIGYTNVTIAKTLIADLSESKIYLDGNQIDYMNSSTEYTWLIHITYQHSTHKVVMVLSSLQSNSSYTVSLEATTIFSGIIIVIIAAILLVYKKKFTKRYPNPRSQNAVASHSPH
jgi:N-acetylneuraminic acid mutarotase